MPAQNLRTLRNALTTRQTALRRFGFSQWALSLNDMPEGLERLLPPSDMRWRRDLRLLEQGEYDAAEGERKRLLKRVASARAAATQPHEPRWFQFHPKVRGADVH